MYASSWLEFFLKDSEPTQRPSSQQKSNDGVLSAAKLEGRVHHHAQALQRRSGSRVLDQSRKNEPGKTKSAYTCCRRDKVYRAPQADSRSGDALHLRSSKKHALPWNLRHTIESVRPGHILRRAMPMRECGLFMLKRRTAQEDQKRCAKV
eukprot:6180418-Pleurochrysis_carterae.AAC.2